MATTLILIFAFSVLVFSFALVSGWQAAYARKCIERAAKLVQQREFGEARQSVLIAVRQNPALKSNPDVQALYEMIVSKSTGDAAKEVDRIILAIPQWPKTKWEKMVGDTRMQIVLIVIIVLSILMKIAAHF